MRREPDRKAGDWHVGHQADQITVPLCHVALGKANTAPGQDKLKIDRMQVASRREPVPVDLPACHAHAANDQLGSVIPDEIEGLQIVQRLGVARMIKIGAAGIYAELDISKMAGNDIQLLRAVHTYGNISLAEQKIVAVITGGKVDLQFRHVTAQTRNDRRKQMMGGKDARRDPYRPAQVAGMPCRRHLQLVRGVPHGAGRFQQGHTLGRQSKAFGMSVKQCQRQRGLHLPDLAADSGLGGAQAARRSRKRPGFRNTEIGFNQGPIEGGERRFHSFMNIISPDYRNFHSILDRINSAHQRDGDPKMIGKALILGGSGRFGRHMSAELWNRGWQVRQFDRETDDLMQASEGMDLIVNGWNPPYQNWQTELPLQTEQIIAAAKASGARILLPANVYVFGKGNGGAFGPDHPHKAENPLGKIRREVEARYRASGVPLLILRSGDYLDTEASGNWFDLIIAKRLAKGRIQYPGDPDVPHAWAFLPDVARIGADLLERTDLPTQLEVGTSDYTLTAREMAQALNTVLGRNVAVSRFGWWQLYLARPFMPILRGVIEMRYLWSLPHWMDQTPLHRWLPGFVPTPLAEALSKCAPVKGLEANSDRPRQAHGGSPVPHGSPVKAR